MERLARELGRRQARQSLLAFTEYTNPLYASANHHRLICEKLEAVDRGEIDRLMIFMPPRHGKSELASKRFPAWCLGRNPRRQIIAASYNSDLANDFGRHVRNIVDEPEFREVFPNVSLATDSHAANRMNTNHGGAYVAAGVGTAVTGRGAHIALIDDPFKDREEADSERRRDLVDDWYRSTLFTRLMPGGAIVLIQCLVGDTSVIMADGREKLLRNVRVGDRVASYCEGRLAPARVLNWKNQGSDCVYEIRMTSGITVKANERHPFLVDRDGELEWVRLRNLKAGDRILRVIGGNGAVSNALTMAATSPPDAEVIAPRTTTRRDGRAGTDRRQSMRDQGGTRTSATDTELASLITRQSLPSRMAAVPFAENCPERTSALIGAESFASIIATSEERFAGFSATTAISRSDTGRPSAFCSQPLDTFGIIPDTIASIEAAGREDVFDIQVEGTENFIANGLVSHNTRWHEDDLAGRLLEREGDQWEVLDLPAIDSNGLALWPEWYDREALDRIRATIGPREWSALYQQKPQPDEGTFFQREWLKEWGKRPEALNIYGTSDYAVTDGGGDYTVHRIWGVDAAGTIYRLDGWRGQTAADAWIDEKLNLIERHKPLAWFGEAGVIQKAVEPMLRRRMLDRKTFCRLEWLPSIHDKPTRARGFQARAAMGKVMLEPGADVSEFLSFPAGKHDDEVDAASLMGRALDMAHPATLRQVQESRNPPDLKQWGRRPTASNWKTI